MNTDEVILANQNTSINRLSTISTAEMTDDMIWHFRPCYCTALEF